MSCSALNLSEQRTVFKALRLVDWSMATQRLSIGVIGPGLVGAALLDQLLSHVRALRQPFSLLATALLRRTLLPALHGVAALRPARLSAGRRAARQPRHRDVRHGRCQLARHAPWHAAGPAHLEGRPRRPGSAALHLCPPASASPVALERVPGAGRGSIQGSVQNRSTPAGRGCPWTWQWQNSGSAASRGCPWTWRPSRSTWAPLGSRARLWTAQRAPPCRPCMPGAPASALSARTRRQGCLEQLVRRLAPLSARPGLPLCSWPTSLHGPGLAARNMVSRSY